MAEAVVQFNRVSGSLTGRSAGIDVQKAVPVVASRLISPRIIL